MEAALGLVALIFLVILVEIVDRLRFLAMSVCVLITAPFRGIGNSDRPFRPPLFGQIRPYLRSVVNALSDFVYDVRTSPCQDCDQAVGNRPNDSPACWECLTKGQEPLDVE